MAWRQQDFILRLIEHIGAAIRRAVGLRESGEVTLAAEELRSASAQLLGPADQLVRQVDTQTAIHIVGDPQRLALWARLLHAEAGLLHAAGEETAATLLRQRSLEVARAAVAKDEGVRELLGEGLPPD